MSSIENYNAAAGRSAAGLVMVQLMREDHIAASKAFEMYGGYCDGETRQALRALLEAFDEDDVGQSDVAATSQLKPTQATPTCKIKVQDV